MSSFSLRQTILLKTSLSSSGSRFVPTFELHDSSLNDFSTLFSQALLLRTRPGALVCMSLRKGLFVVPCRGASFSLSLISCKDCLADHHSPRSHLPILLIPWTNSLPRRLLLVSATSRTLILKETVRSSPRCSVSPLNDTFFLGP